MRRNTAALCGQAVSIVDMATVMRDIPGAANQIPPNISSNPRHAVRRHIGAEYPRLLAANKQCFYSARYSLGSARETTGSAQPQYGEVAGTNTRAAKR